MFETTEFGLCAKQDQRLFVGIIISCFLQSRLSKTFTEIHFCWKMRVNRRLEFGSNSCWSAQVLKKQDILGTYQHLPFLLISCYEDNNRKLRTCLCPTCFQFSPSRLLWLHPDYSIYFVAQNFLLHWMGVTELGHWCLYSRLFPINLSVHNVLCLKLHFSKSPSPCQNGGSVVFFMSMWDSLHHMANQLSMDMRELLTKTSLKTSSCVLHHPASQCNYMYHNILILKKRNQQIHVCP